MIREAKKEDFQQVINLCKDFWSISPYQKEKFIEQDALMKLEIGLSQNLFAVVDYSKIIGFCFGFGFPLLANNNINAGIEAAWYVSPEYRKQGLGKKLLAFMEELAKRKNIKYWGMASIETSFPKEVEKMYLDAGYKKTETTYMKEL